MALQQEVLRVEGMSCNHCKQAVETAVKKLTGMTAAEVDLAAKTLTVEFDNAQTSTEEIRQAVEEAGFEVA